MQSLINTEVKPFKATAFQNGKFETVTEADLVNFIGVTGMDRGTVYDHDVEFELAFCNL